MKLNLHLKGALKLRELSTMYHRMHILRGPILLSIGPAAGLILLRIMPLKRRERCLLKTHMSRLFKKVSYNGHKSRAIVVVHYVQRSLFQWILRDYGMCVPKSPAPSQLFLTWKF